MATEAAGLLSNLRPGSSGNALARRMLLMALGGRAEEGDEADGEFKEPHELKEPLELEEPLRKAA
jgi:hypothetical protein